MRVLVTGASGYIGERTAIRLAEEGYTVFGLIRKKEDGDHLQRHEVTPVVGEITDEKTLAPILAQVSVVIDNVPSFDGEATRTFIKLVQAAAQASGSRKRYIYTSGILLYGDSPNKVLSEEDEAKTKFAAGRLAVEKEALKLGSQKDSLVDGTVLRPGWVYGGNWGRYIANWFSPDKDGNIEILGNPDKRWSWIHIADLANAYVAVVGNKNTVGELFNVGDDSRVTYAQVKEACARAAGVEGKVVHKPAPTDPFTGYLEGTPNCVVSAAKLQRFTGWVPKQGPILDKIGLYARTAKAFAAQKEQAKKA